MITCARCATRTNIHTMSMFNTDEICMKCKDKERNHPKYMEACRREAWEIGHRNFNFEGIGKPDDL